MPTAASQARPSSQTSRGRPNTRNQARLEHGASRVGRTAALAVQDIVKARAGRTSAVPGPSNPAPAAPQPSHPLDAQGIDPRWVSRVTYNRNISMTRALALYKLTKAELEDLPFTMKNTYVNGYTVAMKLYKERDLERRAWQKYNGPEGFLARLDELRERYAARSDATTFKCPAAYERGGVPEPTPDAGPSNPDPHVMRSAKLANIKRSMAPWLWKVCNASLDDYEEVQGTLSRSEREEAMTLALRKLGPKYPPRPDALLPSFPAVDALRAVLKAAPQLPPRPEWGTRKFDGLVYDPGTGPDGEESYEWDKAYLGLLFHALHGVIKAHGRGERGWATMRWEVYQTYKERMEGGICYLVLLDDMSVWDDNAAKWLREDYLDAGLSKYCSVPRPGRTH